MRPRFIALIAGLIGIVLAGWYFVPSWAQQNVPKTNPEAVQAAPKKPAPDKGEAAGGRTEVSGKFGDWLLLCPKEAPTGGNKKGGGCALFQSLAEAKTKKRMFGQTISYGPRGKLVLLVRSPSGVALQKGLIVGIDDGKTYRVPFRTCRRNVCQSLIVLNDEMQKALREGEHATLAVHALNGNQVRVEAPLNGIGAGLDALAKR